MSYYQKSFSNNSSLTVDNLNTTSINNYTYISYSNALSIDISNNLTISGFVSANGFIGNIYKPLNSATDDINLYYQNNSKKMTLGNDGIVSFNNNNIPYFQIQNAGIQCGTISGTTLRCGAITSTGNISNGSNTLSTGTIRFNNGYFQQNASNDFVYYIDTDTAHRFYTANGGNGQILSIDNGSVVVYRTLTTSNINSNGILTIGSIANVSNIGFAGVVNMQFSGGNTYIQFQAGSSNDMIYYNAIGYHRFYGFTVTNGFYNDSDDRIKKNESPITNATTTIMKLKPEIYDKYQNLDCSGNFFRESGLIAQEIYYTCPELRHLINVPKDAHDLENFVPNSINPNQDPIEYSQRWGTSIASLSYIQLIPYLIKSIQELNERITALENQ